MSLSARTVTKTRHQRPKHPPFADGGATVESSAGHFVEVGDTALELAPPSEIPDEQPLTTLEKPTETDEGTILARPTIDAISPVGVRWSGSTTRKNDWMTSLTPFASGDGDDDLVAAIDQPGATLSRHSSTT